VIPSIYWRFKPFGISDIPRQPELLAPSSEAKRFLDEFAAEYLPLDEWALEGTSRREPPWLNARRGLDASDPCDREVLEEDMRVYFHNLQHAA
jgi:uncharacterized phage-associated protein